MSDKTYIVMQRGDVDESDYVEHVFGSLESLLAYRATQGPRWHWPRFVEVWETDGKQLAGYEFEDAPE